MRSPTSSDRLRLEKYRDKEAEIRIYGRRGEGNNGIFIIPAGPECEHYRNLYQCIVSDGDGWEHVSVVVVSAVTRGWERTPTWLEMCAVKDHFWRLDETVIQYHPPKSDYVNVHEHCLHLWRPTAASLQAVGLVDVPRPPISMLF